MATATAITRRERSRLGPARRGGRQRCGDGLRRGCGPSAPARLRRRLQGLPPAGPGPAAAPGRWPPATGARARARAPARARPQRCDAAFGQRLRVGLCGRGDRRGRTRPARARLARRHCPRRRPREPVRNQPEQLAALALPGRQDRLEVGGQGLWGRGRHRVGDGARQHLGGGVGAARGGAERAAHHLGQRRGEEGVVDRRRGGRGRLAQQALVEDRRHPAYVRRRARRRRPSPCRRAASSRRRPPAGAPGTTPPCTSRWPSPGSTAVHGRERGAGVHRDARRQLRRQLAGDVEQRTQRDAAAVRLDRHQQIAPTSRAPAPAGRSGGGPGRRPRRPA